MITGIDFISYSFYCHCTRYTVQQNCRSEEWCFSIECQYSLLLYWYLRIVLHLYITIVHSIGIAAFIFGCGGWVFKKNLMGGHQKFLYGRQGYESLGIHFYTHFDCAKLFWLDWSISLGFKTWARSKVLSSNRQNAFIVMSYLKTQSSLSALAMTSSKSFDFASKEFFPSWENLEQIDALLFLSKCIQCSTLNKGTKKVDFSSNCDLRLNEAVWHKSMELLYVVEFGLYHVETFGV